MKKVLIGFVLLLVTGGVAYTAMGGMSLLDTLGLRSQETVVRSRVDGYWQARLSGDMEEMADYLHPARTEMMQPGLLSTEAYEIVSLTVDGDNAMAVVKVKSRIKHPLLSGKVREHQLDQDWVRYKGTWYQGLRPQGLSETIQDLQGLWTPPTVEEKPAEAPANTESVPEPGESSNLEEGQ